MIKFRWIVAALFLSHQAAGQQDCQFQMIAGVPSTATGDGGAATGAFLYRPHGISVDASGALYIADTQNNRIRRVGPDGVISTIAGNGAPGSSGNGENATAAALNLPEGVFPAPDGSVYIADTGNNQIRKVNPDGTIVLVAGTGHAGFSGDGAPGSAAELNSPTGLALDQSGRLYVADTNNNRIRRIDTDGVIHTVAGSQNPAGLGDNGPATNARLSTPHGVAVASDGTLFIADSGEDLVRKVTADGIITSAVGSYGTSSYPPKQYPAPAGSPLNTGPDSVALLPDGTLLVPDYDLLQLSPDGKTVSQYSTETGFTAGGYVAADSRGNVYLIAYESDVVQIISSTGASSPFAGQNRFGAGTDGASALGPVVHLPMGMAIGPDGGLYVADFLNQRVVKISGGIIRQVATARGPAGVAVDNSGNVFIADCEGDVVSKVAPDGTMTTIAGGGNSALVAFPGLQVPGTSVTLQAYRPVGLVAHPNGNLYVLLMTPGVIPAESLLVRITPAGQFTVLDQWGPGTGLTMYHGIALDPSGNILLPSDHQSTGTQVMKYNVNGNWSGSITLPGLDITGIAVSSSNVMYLGTNSDQILQVATNGLLTTLYNQNLDQYLGQPIGVIDATVSLAIDSQGDLYVSEPGLERIRELPAGSCSPAPQPFVSGILPAPGPPPPEVLIAQFAPGELVSIYGIGLGPRPSVAASLDNRGMIPINLSGVQVSFDGVWAPVLYAGPSQVNAVVPFSVSAGSTVKAVVQYNGVASSPTAISMADAAPALFASGASPIVVNPDGSLNSSSNPAAAGSFVTLYATGLGQTSPAGVDGQINSNPLPTPVLPVSIKSFTADQGFSILYAGGAPGLVEGVEQINIQLSRNPYVGSLQLTVGTSTVTFPVFSK